MRHITTFSIVGKALHAYGQARRHDPALPKPVPGEGKTVTLAGKLCAVLPTQDGGVVGYAVVPHYRLVRLSAGQLAPYRRHVPAATPHERLKRLVGMILNELANVETDADRIRTDLAQRLNAANGNGSGHSNGHAEVTDLADAVGIHLAAE